MSQFQCIVVGCPNTGNPCGWPRLHWLIVKSNPLVLLSHFWISLYFRSFWKEILLLGEHALPIDDYLNLVLDRFITVSFWTAADEHWSSPQTLFQRFSLLLMAKAVALSIRCWTGLRSIFFLFLLFCNACRSDRKSPISPITALRVPWHILQLPPYACESDDSCFWGNFFFSIVFFQLENPFFVKAGSASDEVRIPPWSAFKQVWQVNKSYLFFRHDATT